ncbi:peptidylprolyl isomerase [Erythrobacter rubeus]|uniref:Peptidylprolyl isomerase n=1 Tax=Erythrobacter rubeus TaxID=2760803 RepID=A0ABR8KKV6_9SPHN|nr:peptidylprolyl isomerase [Erythrobacter rubeus]MBD2840953.1 peptidylprolyl isomerase [Erythrobacter rubeus]
MKRTLLTAAAALSLSLPASAQDEPEGAPSPNQIVETASPNEWVAIDAEDLLIMTLAPDADGSERQVIIQLIPGPFSQGWVANIRSLARAHWYDGISVNRVQDNYVVQWGHPGYDNPESGEADTKPLPDGLKVMSDEDYVVQGLRNRNWRSLHWLVAHGEDLRRRSDPDLSPSMPASMRTAPDSYGAEPGISGGFPIAKFAGNRGFGPVHCYGMVGVGRGYSPDTGSGAELYTVIGHAPRHLDRNIALVGRIIAGMEHLSSLPRGTGTLGFYTEDEAELRTPIQSTRVASDLPVAERPAFEYLSTEGDTFARYADARANRRDPFFIVPAGGADICNIPVPVRSATSE